MRPGASGSCHGPTDIVSKTLCCPTFSARTSIWLLDVVTMTSSGEKSCTSTVNWYESPRVLMFPDPPKRTRRAERKEVRPQEQTQGDISFFSLSILIYAACKEGTRWSFWSDNCDMLRAGTQLCVIEKICIHCHYSIQSILKSIIIRVYYCSALMALSTK